MRWFIVCYLWMIRVLLCLKISINCVTPALCSISGNFPAKRLRKILAYQIRMRQLFKKISHPEVRYSTRNKYKQIFYCLHSFLISITSIFTQNAITIIVEKSAPCIGQVFTKTSVIIAVGDLVNSVILCNSMSMPCSAL